jgi:predicted RNA-binding Zn-ribbon protein involved in translation (DUF1610 family)
MPSTNAMSHVVCRSCGNTWRQYLRAAYTCPQCGLDEARVFARRQDADTYRAALVGTRSSSREARGV